MMFKKKYIQEIYIVEIKCLIGNIYIKIYFYEKYYS